MTKTIADPHGPNGLRPGYHWTYGEPGLSTEDLMRSPVGPARGLVPMPWRVSAGRPKAAVVKDGIGTTMAKTFPAKDAQEAYALRCELGDRAYAELTGKRIGRKPAAKPSAKRTKSDAQAAIRTKADGGRPVVLTDHEMMVALGIKPVGYLD